MGNSKPLHKSLMSIRVGFQLNSWDGALEKEGNSSRKELLLRTILTNDGVCHCYSTIGECLLTTGALPLL